MTTPQDPATRPIWIHRLRNNTPASIILFSMLYLTSTTLRDLAVHLYQLTLPPDPSPKISQLATLVSQRQVFPPTLLLIHIAATILLPLPFQHPRFDGAQIVFWIWIATLLLGMAFALLCWIGLGNYLHSIIADWILSSIWQDTQDVLVMMGLGMTIVWIRAGEDLRGEPRRILW